MLLSLPPMNFPLIRLPFFNSNESAGASAATKHMARTIPQFCLKLMLSSRLSFVVVSASRNRSRWVAGFVPISRGRYRDSSDRSGFSYCIPDSIFSRRASAYGYPISCEQHSRHHSHNASSALPTRIGNRLANDRRIRTEGHSVHSSHSELCRRMLCPLMQLAAHEKHFGELAEQLQRHVMRRHQPVEEA